MRESQSTRAVSPCRLFFILVVVGSSTGLSGCGAGTSSVSPTPGLAPVIAPVDSRGIAAGAKARE